MLKKILFILGVVIGLAAIYFYVNVYPMIPIGTGYAAKKMCSCHFIAGRTQESIQKDDLSRSPLNLTSTVINKEAKSATATLFGLGSKTAVFRENLGCILLQGEDDYQVALNLPKQQVDAEKEWPLGAITSPTKIEGVDYAALDQAINSVFDASLNMDSIKTRAVVVIIKIA